MFKMKTALFAATVSLTLASCGQGDVLFVEPDHINLSPVEGNPSAGYVTLNGGPEDLSLEAVTADDAQRIELHETVEQGGATTMNALKEVPIPAGGKVEFEPGGKHLMIWGVGNGSVNRGALKTVFIFSNDERHEVVIPIKQMGAATPTSGE